MQNAKSGFKSSIRITPRLRFSGLVGAVAGLCLAQAVQAQVPTDRTRPPTETAPSRVSPPAPAPPSPAAPARPPENHSGSDRSNPPVPHSSSSDRGSSDNRGGSHTRHEDGQSSQPVDRASRRATRSDSVTLPSDGRSRPGAGTTGSTASGARNGASLGRFRKTAEGAIYETPPGGVSPGAVAYGYPYYGPWEQPDVYGYPYPIPTPPDPGDRSTRDDSSGEPDRKIDPLAVKTAQELKTAWLESDIALIARHVRRDIEIRVSSANVLKKTSDSSDFLADTRYAFDEKTTAVTINQVKSTGPHRYDITLVRTVRDLQGYESTHTVRYAIRRIDGVYIITGINTDD